ncbi:MAG: thiol reductase thioredoxin [Proteobacteria bacterium]|nr:MAG: thiol reductase thioredoxin [Pseudomonadota bacterium]
MYATRMSNSAELFDKRSDFFRGFFERGAPYEVYLESSPQAHQSRWRDFEQKVELSAPQRDLLLSFTRRMNVLVLSGSWCGDCARQGPMLAAIERSCPAMNMHFIDNGENPELADELRIHGASRVPVVVVLSEDFFEVARFGDRTLTAYRRKAKGELGPACDSGIAPPGGTELQGELAEWIDFFERLQLMLRLSPFLRKRHND